MEYVQEWDWGGGVALLYTIYIWRNVRLSKGMHTSEMRRLSRRVEKGLKAGTRLIIVRPFGWMEKHVLIEDDINIFFGLKCVLAYRMMLHICKWLNFDMVLCLCMRWTFNVIIKIQSQKSHSKKMSAELTHTFRNSEWIDYCIIKKCKKSVIYRRKKE